MYQHNIDYFIEFDPELGDRICDVLEGGEDEIGLGVIEAVEAYERDGNEWWLSDDPNIYGYYQLFEPKLLMSFGKFHEAVEGLLGRGVYTHEFGRGFGIDELREEAEAKRQELGYF